MGKARVEVHSKSNALAYYEKADIRWIKVLFHCALDSNLAKKTGGGREH